MTKQQLNRDIKKLNQAIKGVKRGVDMIHENPSSTKSDIDGINNTYFEYINGPAKTEFTRLYFADSNFEYCNKESVLIMLRLNLRHRFIPIHQFGLQIEI